MSNSSAIKKIIEEVGCGRESLLPALQAVMREKGSLMPDDLREISNIMQLSAADVYGVASFYSFLEPGRQYKNVIRICKTISCEMKNKREIVEALEKKLGIKIGETTADGVFTLSETNCLGHCHEGPAMLVNDDIYTRLTPEKAVAVIEKYIEKEK